MFIYIYIYIYRSELVVYADFKGLARKIASDKVLRLKTFIIAKIP